MRGGAYRYDGLLGDRVLRTECLHSKLPVPKVGISPTSSLSQLSSLPPVLLLLLDLLLKN